MSNHLEGPPVSTGGLLFFALVQLVHQKLHKYSIAPAGGACAGLSGGSTCTLNNFQTGGGPLQKQFMK